MGKYYLRFIKVPPQVRSISGLWKCYFRFSEKHHIRFSESTISGLVKSTISGLGQIHERSWPGKCSIAITLLAATWNYVGNAIRIGWYKFQLWLSSLKMIAKYGLPPRKYKSEPILGRSLPGDSTKGWARIRWAKARWDARPQRTKQFSYSTLRQNTLRVFKVAC